METHASLLTLRVLGLSAVVWAAIGSADAAEAEGRTPMREVLTAQLPRYEPNAEAPKPAVAENEVKTRATLIRLPAVVPRAPAASSESRVESAVPKDAVMLLPEVTVTEKYTQVPRLPRLNVSPPVRDLPAVPFESDAARKQRLVKKHLSSFDRFFLNRFTLPLIGISKEARAEQMEAAEVMATTLNNIAEGIEALSGSGKTPQEKAQLREMYYDVLVQRHR